MGSIEVQVIRVSTPFNSREDFVGAFRNYVTEDSCFIPSTTMKTVGVETGFSIRLADGTPVLRGLGVVLDSWATDENPWHKPGIRLGLRKLTKETRAFFDELQHARLARGSRDIIDERAAVADEAQATNQRPAAKRRMESMSDAPMAIESTSTGAPVVISFFDANNEHDEDAPASARPTRAMRVVSTDDGVPMAISDELENATERVEMTDFPQRSEVQTLLGFAPLPKPERASTERERDTVLGMAPLVAPAENGLAAIGPIAIESMAVPLPMNAQIVSLPGLAHLWDSPELAALAALETTAIIERPHRRRLTDWFARIVWRVRAWYRTRSMR